MPALLVSTVAVALALPSGPAMERECVAANVQARPASCLVSDLDGDHLADYALSLDISGLFVRPASISIHLSGEPQVAQLLLPEGLSVLSFIFRDVNGDGQPDIALLGGFNETVGVFLNDGSGGFRYDRQDRYLTPPNRDSSEMAPPAGAPSCDCAESDSGSSCVASAQGGITRKLPSVNNRPGRDFPSLTLRSVTTARSRAP